MKAIWNNITIAESDDTVVVENNHYFPQHSLKREFFKSSDKISRCPWKGEARYLSVIVDGEENTDAAWYYPEPKEAAANIKDRIAFWRGVNIVD